MCCARHTENCPQTLTGSGYHYICEEDSLEEDVWSSGVNYGIRNKDVNPSPGSFTVCPFLPLCFLGGEIYRGNVQGALKNYRTIQNNGKQYHNHLLFLNQCTVLFRDRCQHICHIHLQPCDTIRRQAELSSQSKGQRWHIQ